MRTASYTLASVSALVCVAVFAHDSPVVASNAGTPQGEVLPIVAIAEAGSLLGEDTVIMTGWMDVVRQPPRMENGVEVVGLEIPRLQLVGASRFGRVSVTEREGLPSTGELRPDQPGTSFPASSVIQLLVDLELPSTPFGKLNLHNDEAFTLRPTSAGAIDPLQSWPPFGVTFATAMDECLPLLDEAEAESDVGICVNGLSIEVAPLTPSFSVGRNASRESPADILSIVPSSTSDTGQSPYVRVSCADLGLAACGDSSPQDNIDALSYGILDGGQPHVSFSVAHGALGVDGTGVWRQNQCPPGDPGISPEPESDVFRSTLSGSNAQLFDGNGPVGACVSTFPLGLLESIAARDDLNAFDEHDPSVLEDGTWIYLSLDKESPSLPTLNASGADILRTEIGGEPTVYASHTELGLGANDDIDALCLAEDGDGAYSPADRLLFSLSPDSPSLTAIGAGPGDLIAPGPHPTVVHASAALGLLAQDDLNAAACSAFSSPTATGDANCDGQTNSVDASLILQFVAGLLSELPCPDRADMDRNGITSVDAALVLQAEAGLLDLPV